MITEDDGSYTIEGLTENLRLTTDGETDGITVNENGSFIIAKNYQIMKIINHIR